jgi:hypothetical protein
MAGGCVEQQRQTHVDQDEQAGTGFEPTAIGVMLGAGSDHAVQEQHRQRDHASEDVGLVPFGEQLRVQARLGLLQPVTALSGQGVHRDMTRVDDGHPAVDGGQPPLVRV